MAKITDNRYECDYCEKPFKTAQGVRAHARHCSTRRLRQQAATQAEAEPASGSRPTHLASRPGPDSQEMKLLLLDVNEDIIRLYRDAEDHTFWADFFSRTARNHVEGHATPEEWVMIYHDLGDVTRDLDLMVGPLRLDRSLLFTVYHRMQAIQGAWLAYRARDFTRGGEVTPEGEDVLREERAFFADLMLKIKRMLVAAR
jgi:hypothetical protein